MATATKTLADVQANYADTLRSLPGYLYTKFEVFDRTRGVDMSVRSTFELPPLGVPEQADMEPSALDVIAFPVYASRAGLVQDLRKVPGAKTVRLAFPTNIRHIEDKVELVFVIHIRRRP